MTHPHIPASVHDAGHWTAVHVRRHFPFALFSAGVLSAMGWFGWMLSHI